MRHLLVSIITFRISCFFSNYDCHNVAVLLFQRTETDLASPQGTVTEEDGVSEAHRRHANTIAATGLQMTPAQRYAAILGIFSGVGVLSEKLTSNLLTQAHSLLKCCSLKSLFVFFSELPTKSSCTFVVRSH